MVDEHRLSIPLGVCDKDAYERLRVRDSDRGVQIARIKVEPGAATGSALP